MKNKLLFISIFFSLMGCETHFIKNHFVIKSFNVICDDSIKTAVILRFDLDYYSDSTFQNYYENSIQKGQDGSIHEILYLGYSDFSTMRDSISSDDKIETFNSFKRKYNEKQHMYTGEMLDKDLLIHTNKNCHSKPSQIILIRKNLLSSQIDTLYANRNE
jgi:hypothetical protein